MPLSRPTEFLSWIPNASTSNNIAQPPLALSESGYTSGQPLEAQYLNYSLNLLDQWVQALASGETAVTQATALNHAMRLYGGGTLTYSASNQLLSWSSPITIAIPSCSDSDNQIATGSIMVPAGSVAYVNANVPFTAQADYASGANALQGVSDTSGIATGMSVVGPGIPSGTTVTGISSGQVDLSSATTQAETQANVSFASSGALTVQTAVSQNFVPSPNSIILARGVGFAISIGIGDTEFWLRDQEVRTLLSEGYVTTTFAPAGQTLAPAQAVYLSSGAADGRTQGSVYLTDASVANASTRSTCIGFVHTATLSANTVHVVSSGIVSGFSQLTPGAVYYLDPNNVGGITSAMTTTLGQALMSIGTALSGTMLLVHMGRPQIVTNTFPNGSVVTGNVTATGGMSNAFGFKQTLPMGCITNSLGNVGTFNQTQELAYDGNAKAIVSLPKWPISPFNGSVMAICIQSSTYQNTFSFVLKARAPGSSLSERVVYQQNNVGLSPYYDQGLILLYFNKGSLSLNAGEMLSFFISDPNTNNYNAEVSLVLEMESMY